MTLSRSWRGRSLAFFAVSLCAVLALAWTLPPKPRLCADGPATNGKLDFNRDVRPILTDACFACHGPDAKKRKGDLRLDVFDAALKDYKIIIPGKSAESELYKRLISTVASKKMPPAKHGKTLTVEQIATLKRWIDEGGSYSVHWAYTVPTRGSLPKVKNSTWVHNPIDQFVLARIEAAGLSPSPEADRVTLIRRATFDLTGLPPTPAEVDAFLADQSPDAYEKVIDRLLSLPAYGEHMARYWLDLARFGDTHGLHLDNYREMWLYRDWVVKAFNHNMPYDRFVTAQLAGDLLPGNDINNLVATGFNRAHVTTSEGGSIEEEVRVRNVNDRVETTGTVFLGLTIGCARCHDHKFDPITMKDFYALSAYFNSLDGKPLDGNAPRHAPTIRVPTEEQQAALEAVEKKIAAVRKEMTEKASKIVYDDGLDANESEQVKRGDFVWIDDTLPSGAKAESDGQAKPWTFVKEPVHSGALAIKHTHAAVGQHYFTGANPGLKVGAGDKLFAYVYLDPKNPPKQIMLQWHTKTWLHRAYWGANLIQFGRDASTERRKLGELPEKGKWVRLDVPIAQVGLKPGMTITGWAFTQHGGTVYWDKAGINTQVPQSGGSYDTLTAWVRAQKALKGAGLPQPIAELIKIDRKKRTKEQQQQLRDYFVQNAWSKTHSLLAPLRGQVAALEAERNRIDQQMPYTYIFRETAKPREAYMLKRGEYDQKGEKVDRATPGFLLKMPEKTPNNRLGLARWLLDEKHPLTARVTVNRYWQQVFGTGLVKTSEDFGLQGEMPSHPRLLDWLAVEYRESGWDTRAFMRLMLTSATYRQSARVTKDRLAKDPANRLLARGPRFRLDAEMLRDQALAVSELMVRKLGGPSVKPPQPQGVWSAVAYVGSNTGRFTADRGIDKVHRRSLYTFWKRTAPPPQMSVFDAPSREACVARRERTNTPLQALVLLNDPQFVECYRALAERAIEQGVKTDAERLTYLFRKATGRQPEEKELAELTAALKDLRAEYAKDVEAAKKLISIGETKPSEKIAPAELAAWAMIATTVMNLDEVLNKG